MVQTLRSLFRTKRLCGLDSQTVQPDVAAAAGISPCPAWALTPLPVPCLALTTLSLPLWSLSFVFGLFSSFLNFLLGQRPRIWYGTTCEDRPVFYFFSSLRGRVTLNFGFLERPVQVAAKFLPKRRYTNPDLVSTCHGCNVGMRAMPKRAPQVLAFPSDGWGAADPAHVQQWMSAQQVSQCGDPLNWESIAYGLEGVGRPSTSHTDPQLHVSGGFQGG